MGITRASRLELLAGRKFDLLVIGGGAVGASTAWAASRAGATVAVVEAGDAAGATSSASTKLLHGGLRYLATGDLKLVREAHEERRAHVEIVAPHLVRHLRFVVPVNRDSPRRPWEVRAGVTIYGGLTWFRDGRSGPLSAGAALELVPALRPDAVDAAAVYHDHQTDDARLVLAALQTAQAYGAVWINHAEVEHLRTTAGEISGAEVLDRITGERLTVEARAVVNATGPWVDAIRRLENPKAGTSVRLSKGAHLVLATDRHWDAAVTTPLADDRVSFAIPWHGMLLLGTTDEAFEGDPATVRATQADVDQILTEASRALVPDVVRPELVRSSFAGLRVLPVGGGATSDAPRETVVTVGSAGMVSVAGGKLTTWRRIGLEVAERALEPLDIPRISWYPSPVVGAGEPAAIERRIAAEWSELPQATVRHLAHLYGWLALDVLRPAHADPSLLDPVADGGPDILAQAAYAVEAEQAVTTDDILRRRTTVAIRGLDDSTVLERVEPFLDVVSRH